MLNIIPKLYSKKSADYENLVFSIGIILVSLLFVSLSNLMFYGVSLKQVAIVVVYALFAWGSIRIIGCFTYIGEHFLSRAQAFSITFLLYFCVIVLLGYKNINLPLKEIAYISLADFIIFSIINIKDFIKSYLFLLAAVFALLLCALMCIRYQTPWFYYFSPAGVGNIDTFRDAAVIRGWSDYNVITHGTHGLLYTPYHSLFALFHSSFLKFTDNNAFIQLQYYGFLVAPALFIYGILKLIGITSHESVIKYKFCYVIIFALSYSAICYSFSQCSTTMATFLTIVCMPVIFDVWKNRNASWISLLILAACIPLMLHARAFHGLVLVMLCAPLILDRRPMWKGVIPFLGCLSGLAVLILFYGKVQRNSDIYFSSVSILWTPRLLDPALKDFIFSTPLIILTCFFIALWKKDKNNWAARLNSPYSRQIALGLGTIAAASLACLKALGYSDVLYITILMSWILFFLLISQDIFAVSCKITRTYFLNLQNFFGVKFSISYDKTKEILKKRQVNFVKYGVLVLLIFPIISGMDQMEKDIRTITRKSPYISLNKDTYKICPSHKYDPLCKVRLKKLGVTDIRAFSETTLPAQMGEIALRKIKDLSGNTAIYIPPLHPYWNFFSKKEYTGLYFMAEYGIPLIYGLNSDDPGYGYSYVKYKGGTLKSLEEIGGVGMLCKTANDLDIENIIIFSGSALDNEVISCRNLAL